MYVAAIGSDSSTSSGCSSTAVCNMGIREAKKNRTRLEGGVDDDEDGGLMGEMDGWIRDPWMKWKEV